MLERNDDYWGPRARLARVDARVPAGIEHGHQGQLEFGVGRAAVLVIGGLADAGDGHLAA